MFTINDIKKVEYFDCSVKSHEHETMVDAEICFRMKTDHYYKRWIISVEIAIDVLSGYTYDDIRTKYKPETIDVKYHTTKSLSKIINMHNIDYELIIERHDDNFTGADYEFKSKSINEIRESGDLFLLKLIEFRNKLENDYRVKLKIK